ncbi:hypothetical protein BHR79_04125 [Methanohalophilus halophilus]|uniref:Uncharacterized protein n=1 Tax=Methanohalophilus halophilus TaxID=2177 RepID=A0A1L3Q1K0_9EURY|nr:hypothetical protein BHR79_04125 [Methanohalophilus halophilus]SDW74234.1 hypothetical protein SAMN04515625_1549 [Methanohalophilus halophilus]
MDIVAFSISIALFLILSVAVLFIFFRYSSFFAILLLTIPIILATIIVPEPTATFLSIQHFMLDGGNVPINNYHILFIVWTTLTGIIIYSEFLTWYLAKRG